MSESTINILLIENPTPASYVYSALQAESSRYNLISIPSLTEGRKYLSGTLPDIIISELQLSDGPWTELSQNGGKLISCPMILVAEESTRKQAFEAVHQGASDYIVKERTPIYEIPRIIDRALREKIFAQEYKTSQKALLDSEERAKSSYELIRLILKGTSSKRGADFLNSLVQHLALALKIPYAGIGKLDYPDKKHVSVLSFWNGKDFGDRFQYDLKDTPCDNVFKKEWSVYPENVCGLFPKDRMLVDIGIESYMGISLFDESDKAIGIIWVMGTQPFQDVPFMKEIMTIFAARAETELQMILLEDSQEMTESFSQSVIDGVNDGVITINEKGIIQTFNLSAEKIFGYSPNEVIGKNVNLLMPEPYKNQHKDYLSRYLNTGNKKIIGIGREVEGLRKDGSTFPMDLSISGVLIKNKHYFTGIIRDITDRKRFEQELIEAKIKAEKASHTKTEFLSRMSHELRTPLNSIMGFGQLLEMAAVKNKFPEDQANFIDQVLRAGSHLLELVNEVLDLSRVESGKINVQFEAIPLFSLAEEMCSLMQPLAKEGGVLISNRIKPSDPVAILADKSMIKQCMLNLLSNAVKYNHAEGEVELYYHSKEKGKILLCVSDNGPGLSEKQKAYLFQPFERLGKEYTDIEGTGIGLAITKKMVELMGGSIGNESQLGKGSTFYIELPLYSGPSSEQKVQVVHPANAPRPDKEFKILYIEDNRANLHLIEQILVRFSGIQLITAHNGRQGIQKVQEHLPDLILLDMGLPDMVGMDVIKELKKQRETKNIPIVVLSANALPSQIGETKKLGIEHYITKPIDINEFSEMVCYYTG